MSKSESLIQDIAWLKFTYGVSVAIDAPLIAWLVQNYTTAKPVFITAGIIIVIIFALLIVLVHYRAYHRIKELEKL